MIFSLLLIGAFLLTTSCGKNQETASTETETETRTETETDVKEVVSNSTPTIEDYDIEFARDDLSKKLKKIMRFDMGTEGSPLEINGKTVSVSLKVYGRIAFKDEITQDMLNLFSKSSVEMVLIDDDDTEIGNQRLQLMDITLRQLADWVINNSAGDKKEITFMCKDFSNVEKARKTERVKLVLVEGLKENGQ